MLKKLHLEMFIMSHIGNVDKHFGTFEKLVRNFAHSDYDDFKKTSGLTQVFRSFQ